MKREIKIIANTLRHYLERGYRSILQTLIYLKHWIAGHLTIFGTRTKSP